MENNNINFKILLQQNELLFRDNKILSKALLKIESDVQEHEIILNKKLDGFESEIKSFEKVYNDLQTEIHNYKSVITARNFEIEDLNKTISLLKYGEAIAKDLNTELVNKMNDCLISLKSIK